MENRFCGVGYISGDIYALYDKNFKCNGRSKPIKKYPESEVLTIIIDNSGKLFKLSDKI